MGEDIIWEIIEQFGTPLYLYDLDKIEKCYIRIRKILPDQFRLYYSMKCNPLLALCAYLRNLGTHVEVASGGELLSAFKAGYKKKEIIFTSPGKTEEELRAAVKNEIYCINVESITEIEMLQNIAGEQASVDIAIRINPDFSGGSAGLMMSGVPTQFGIDYRDVGDAIRLIDKCNNLRLIGFHVYLGTQILSSQTILNATRQIIELALKITEKHNIKMRFLDIGGGYGTPYFHHENELDDEVLRIGFAEIMNEYGKKLKGVTIATESGRFLVAESGLFITKILYKKNSKGKSFIICDGGSNQHANSAFLGRFIRDNFPVVIIKNNSNSGKQPIEKANISGPLCTPTDIIAQNVEVNLAEPGDLVVIHKSGAYGLTNSPILFLSHPTAAEVVLHEGHARLVRERGDWDEFSNKQIL